MDRIKLISYTRISDVEEEVNNWTKKTDGIEIVKIEHSTAYDASEGWFLYSIMIHYREIGEHYP